MEKIKELDELKRIELNILKLVHRFCVDNNIWYMLTYGTLLGAIRHSGFIPWDDDIDIHMTRDGYNTFIDLFPQWGEKHGLKLIGNMTENNIFPRDLIKVCDNKTILYEKQYKNSCELGVFIDIWPLDKVPVELSYKDKFWISYTYFIKRIALASDINTKSNVYKELSNMKKIFILLLGHFNSHKLVKKQSKISQKHNNLTEAKYISFQANKRFYNHQDIFPVVLHKFEDEEFFVPNNFDAILKLTYGDYWILPPENKRKPLHTQDAYWKD